MSSLVIVIVMLLVIVSNFFEDAIQSDLENSPGYFRFKRLTGCLTRTGPDISLLPSLGG